MDSILPWGGAVLVWIEETTDAMIEPTRLAVCSCTSANISSGWGSSSWGSSGWGSSCGWGGDGTCWVWTSDKEGDDSTWIGDTGGGEEGGAIFWRFAWDLVLLGPFLLAWLAWGASTIVLELLVFTDLPGCWCNNKGFVSTSVTRSWWNSGWNSKIYRWCSHSSRCVLKKWCKYGMELVSVEWVENLPWKPELEQ